MIQALLALLLITAPDPASRSKAWRVVDTYGTGEACDLACSPWLIDADRDTICINAALERGLTDERYNAVELPPGNCYINDRLDILAVKGVEVYGHGRHRTVLIWESATPADPLLYLGDVSESYFHDFSIIPNGTRTVTVAVELDNCAACAFSGESNVGHGPSKNTFERITIGAPAGNQTLVDGFVVETDTDGANNEFHAFRDVLVQRHHGDAWRLESAQHKTVRFDNCGCLSDTTFVETTTCVRSVGCFVWTGGGGGFHDYDFYMASTGCQTTINGANFEGSHKFLYHGGNNSNYSGLTIMGVRWTSEGVSPSATGSDRYIIQSGYSGGVVILASNFGTPSDLRPLGIRIEGGPSPFVMLANAWHTSLTSPSDIFTQGVPTLYAGNMNRVGGLPVEHGHRVWPNSSGATPAVYPGYVHDEGVLNLNDGTTAITNFLQGHDGQELVLWANGSAGRVVTHDGSNIDLAGDESLTMAGDDILVLRRINGTWMEVGRAASAWSGATVRASTSVATNLVSEFTAASGVTIDSSAGTGVLVKDGSVTLGTGGSLLVTGTTSMTLSSVDGHVNVDANGSGRDVTITADGGITLTAQGDTTVQHAVFSGASAAASSLAISGITADDSGAVFVSLDGAGNDIMLQAATVRVTDAFETEDIEVTGTSATLCRLLVAARPDQATTGTTEQTLWDYTLPANGLSGASLRFTVVAALANNANSKAIYLKEGSTGGGNVAAVATNVANEPVHLTAYGIDDGTDSQWYSSYSFQNNVFQDGRITTATRDEDAAITYYIRGHTSDQAGDLTLKLVIVERCYAP